MTLKRRLPRRTGGELHTGLLVGVVLLGTLVSGCVGMITEAAERQALTRAHGDEVKSAIERYHTIWLSREAFLNPTLQYEVATEQWTNDVGLHAAEDPPTGAMATSAAVSEVNVFEYTPTRFKAWAHATVTFDEVSLQGEVLRTWMAHYRGTYVFLKSDGKWRLGAFLADEDWRGLEHAPEWMRQLIGEPAHR